MEEQSQLTGSHEAWQRPSTPLSRPHQVLIDATKRGETAINSGEYPIPTIETREMLDVFFSEISENNEKLSDKEIYLMAKCVLERGKKHALNVIVALNGKLIQKIVTIMAVSWSATKKYGTELPKFEAIHGFTKRFYSAFMSEDNESCEEMEKKLEPIIKKLEEAILQTD